MIKLLLFLCFLAATGILATWVAEHPGQVTMFWQGYRIDTSVAFLLLAALAAAVALAFAFLLARGLLRAPRLLSQRRLHHYQRGLSEITTSVAALAAADIKTAELHTRKAEKLLGPTPLTLLVSAQIARSRGDDTQTRLLLEQMLTHKETEYLAARSLSETASRQQLFPKALHLAQRAHAVNPKEKAAVVAMISLHARLAQWQEATLAINRAVRKGRLSRQDGRRFRGLVQLKQGMQLMENGQFTEALAHGRAVAKALPEFAPAVAFAARAYSANGQPGKAVRLIFAGWKRAPHPALAAALLTIIAKEPADKQRKLVGKLASLQPQHAESQIILAQMSLRQKDWQAARKALKAALEQEETVLACKLMAQVEQEEFSDFDAAGKWLARSADALPDAQWVCNACGQIAAEWDMHCPSCGAFDTLEWKRRSLSFVS